MPLNFIIAAIVTGMFIAMSHVFAVFSGWRGVVGVATGIVLHLALVLILLFGGASLEILALAMMLSLLAYTALSFVKYKLKDEKEGGEME